MNDSRTYSLDKLLSVLTEKDRDYLRDETDDEYDDFLVSFKSNYADFNEKIVGFVNRLRIFKIYNKYIIMKNTEDVAALNKKNTLRRLPH